MKFFISLIAALCISLASFAQNPVYHSLKVVFIGNSYVYVNTLPTIISDIATSMGDTLITDGNTIGGYTFQQHSADATSKGKIMQGGLDYVVLQEQSQRPSFPIGQVETDVFPYAQYLDSLNHAYNACGRTMFYVTWGRKNGDPDNCPTWPPICTYNGMDSLLQLRYSMMADDNNAVLSPVAAVWRYIRAHYPAIELYQADESHPSPAGSYAAACCFYTAFFRKDPTTISYNYTLSATDAANIRTAAKAVVYDSMLHWHIGEYDPSAQFTYTAAGGFVVTFTNTSANATNYTWYFGDGDTSTSANPVHTYATPGNFNVMLVASTCNSRDTMHMMINTWPTAIADTKGSDAAFVISPNPAGNYLNISSGMFSDSKCRIRIINAMGKVMYDRPASNNNEQALNITSLPAGIYVLSIADGQKTLYQHQFIKAAR